MNALELRDIHLGGYVEQRVIGVFGASGFAREVMPLVEASMQGRQPDVRLVFVDIQGLDERLNGFDVLSYEQFLAIDQPAKQAVIAISDSNIRQQVAEQCTSDGVAFLAVQADSVRRLYDTQVEEGAILCHFSQLTSNVRIGRHFHCNIYSYVAHDCVIGDYVTFAPNVCCNGNVHIEDHAYIGTGAILKQGAPDKPLVIGAKATVGMGAVVTKDVPAGVTVVGNPARVFQPNR